MPRLKLLWQLYPTYILIVLMALVMVGSYMGDAVHQFYIDQTLKELEAKAKLSRNVIESFLTKPENLGKVCRRIASDASARITVVLPNGRVICDSKKQPARMDNRSDRPEIVKVLTGKTGTSFPSIDV